MRDDFTHQRQGGGATPLLLGLGLGAGLAYLLDPNGGRRRRAYIRDQAVHQATAVRRAIPVAATDLMNRSRGLASEIASRFRREPVSERILEERVRSAMGRVVSHPHAIQVRAENGRIILSGPVLSAEEDQLLSTAAAVRGVSAVENQLERHQDAGRIPALQGGASRSGRIGSARENWPPATRLLAGAAGGALAATGMTRKGAAGAAMGILGTALLIRAMTNLPADRLMGAGAGRRAIDFRKTLNINASPEEVFAFCSMWENFPRFMTHVREIKGEGQRSHWVVDGPAGIPVSWDAVVTQFIPNDVLAWKSVEGSAINNAGIMRFDQNPDGSTRLDIRVSYNPPAGAIGHTVATLLGANPERQMDEDFNRLKSLIETGKTSTPGQGEITREELAV